jgi:hypothetical protein
MTVHTLFSAAALLAIALTATPAAIAQMTPETNQPWCGVVDSDWECVYATLADCEQSMLPEGQECAPNPRSKEEKSSEEEK